VPFRDAHGIVGGLVRHALESGRTLSQLSDDELSAHAPELDGEFYDVLQPERWLEGKVSEGGTSLERVREQLAAARRHLG
jgi:argininosuccinate lyase